MLSKHLRPSAIAGLAIASLATFAFSAEAQTPLRAGIYNLKPFGGDPADGYCFDLINEMAQRVGWTVEFVPMSATDLVARLAAGDIDFNCSALAATNARREQGIVFSGPILTNRDALIVRADDTGTYTGVADLQGRRLGAPVNSAFLQTLQNAGFANVTAYPGLPEAIAALNAHEIDGFITISTLFQYNHDALGQWQEVKAAEGWVPLSTNYGTFAVETGNTELLGVIQNALEGMKLDGTLNTLADEWAVPRAPF